MLCITVHSLINITTGYESLNYLYDLNTYKDKQQQLFVDEETNSPSTIRAYCSRINRK